MRGGPSVSQHWVPPEAGSQTGLPMKSTKQRPVLHLPRPCMQTVIGSAFKELHRVHLPAVVAVSTTFIKAGKKKKPRGWRHSSGEQDTSCAGLRI